jgi:hypothetical protein
LDASGSTDPDGNVLRFEWFHYPEATAYRGKPVPIENAQSAKAAFLAPAEGAQPLHIILTVTDDGSPALTRYARVRVTISNNE